MGKKNRQPNSLFAKVDAADKAAPASAEEQITQIKPAEENFDSGSFVGKPTTFNKEEREKLEIFDRLQDENKALNAKLEDYEAKITEYISQIEWLNKTNADVEQIKKDDEAKSKEIEQLKKDIKVLQGDADSYLMKIAELSFENAKLQSGEKPTPPPVTIDTTKAPVISKEKNEQSRNRYPHTQHRKVKYIHPTNGYTSWN